MINPLPTIQTLVRDAESNLTDEIVTLSEHVQWSLFENNNKIDAYLNSKHTSGETDAQGREKPFFNIVIAAVNIWHRATDIDRKNIRFRADKAADVMLSFIATILLTKWMRSNIFGKFLNEWGRALAIYGSIPVKFIEKGKELYAEVIPWNRMICDQIDFENNIKIEKLWLTPAQLRKNKLYNQEYVEEIIDKAEQSRKTLDGQKKNDKVGYIPIYEVHGELPLAYLTGKEEEDGDEYVQQMHTVCFETKKEKSQSGDLEYDDYTLYSGKENKDPYLLTHLLKEDGRVQGKGAVENLFEAQWMMNHTAKLIKDQLDLSSKLIYQTADANFYGQNAITAIQNGDILIHELNKPLTQVNNGSHDITQIQSYGAQWKSLSNEINSISEAMLGAAPKSGTAWRQTEALLQESHSLFELMTENKGLDIELMMRKFYIPHLKKKLDTTEELSEILDEYQIKQIDNVYVPNEAIRRMNRKLKKDILSKPIEDIRAGKLFSPEMQQNGLRGEITAIQEQLGQMGNQRFIKPSDIDGKPWKEVMKDFNWNNIAVDITGEEKDTQGVMATLSAVLQTIAGLRGQPMSEDMKTVFNKILELTGAISPLEIGQQTTQQPVVSVPAVAPATT